LRFSNVCQTVDSISKSQILKPHDTFPFGLEQKKLKHKEKAPERQQPNNKHLESKQQHPINAQKQQTSACTNSKHHQVMFYSNYSTTGDSRQYFF
jgi:hypothetical protein